MDKLTSFFEKLMPYILKFANAKPTSAIKDGFILTMPLTLIGSIFLLIANIPVPGYTDMMTNLFGAGWDAPLYQVVGATFDIVALVGVFGIAYAYTKNEGFDGVSSGILGIVSMIIVSSSSVTAGGETVGGVIPKAYMGGKGMIAAIIIGLSVGYIYSWFIKRDIRIKMPEGVPQGVANAFTALIPAAFIMVVSFIVFLIFDKAYDSTLVVKIYDVLQTPIQNMTDSLGGVILIPFLIGICWWCGIHGSTLIMGVMGPILTANSLANQAIVDSGQTLVAGENAKILTAQLIDQFVTFGGAGITLGLVIAMIWAAKSAHFKQLGKLSILPGIFNINEPVLFGMPIVFNPIMLIPFVLVPTASALITYFGIAFGIIDPFAGILVPWTTPPVISGFLVGGWKAALLQIAMIAMSTCIYYPFMKMADKQAFETEQNSVDSDEDVFELDF